MDNIYKAVQLTIDSQNLALSKKPTHVYIANQYVDTNDTPLITAPFIIQKALENGTGVVDIVSSTIGSIYEVRLLCEGEMLISGYFYMPPMNAKFSELELYTSYPPRTPPVINEFWQQTEQYILEKTNTLLNFVQVFNGLSSMRLSLGYLEELATSKKSNLVSAINEVYKRYEGVGDLYEKNVEAGAGANGWTDALVEGVDGRNQRQINAAQKITNDNQAKKNSERISIKDYGAIGDGTLHTLQEWIDSGKFSNLAAIQMVYEFATSLTNSIDYVAIAQAFKDARTKKKSGLVSTIIESGATVVVPDGKYLLDGITQTLHIICDVDSKAADFVVPASYNGEVIRVGEDRANYYSYNMNATLPNIYKPTGSNFIGTGSTGVRIANLNSSTVKFGRINYFETLLDIGGEGAGNAYNKFYLNMLAYGKKLLSIVPRTGGWANDNKFFGGTLQIQSVSGVRLAGFYQLYIDGTNSTVADNEFFGVSLEGAGADDLIYMKWAINNKIYGHHESGQGLNPKTFTYSGDTLTHIGHTLQVGDMITVYQADGATMPTGMYIFTNYYVVSVSGDTFKIARNQSGSAESFGGSVANMRYMVQQRCRFVGGNTSDNVLIDFFTPLSASLQIIQEGGAAGNGYRKTNTYFAERNYPANQPLFRGKNTNYTATFRPIFAAYENNVDFDKNPDYWRTALSPRGLQFGDGAGNVSSEITTNATIGFLQYVNRKTPTLPMLQIQTGVFGWAENVTGTIPANSGLTINVSKAGLNVIDTLIANPVVALPVGVVLAWCRVGASDTAQVHLYNITAAPIVVNQNFRFSHLINIT